MLTVMVLPWGDLLQEPNFGFDKAFLGAGFLLLPEDELLLLEEELLDEAEDNPDEEPLG